MIAAIEDSIAREGSLPLARAMAMAADHYYATREPFGPRGDFVTAPEVSQMFGELVGLWLADLWQRAGAPAPVALVELGPGRGTLMADALRAIERALPAFAAAIELHLVEKSPRLRLLQKTVLPPAAQWHDGIDSLPADRPLMLVANEFLDALPLSQFERTADGWALRRVAADGWDIAMPTNLAFVPEALRDAPEGSVFERNFAAEALVAGIARRIAAQGGAGLFIDYGYSGPALGDTLQALKGGAFAKVIETLGEADISAHVDFTAMARAASGAGAHVFGPQAQGLFLEALGLSQRARALKAVASLERAAEIEAARVRLASAGGMGRLFQALAIAAPDWPVPAGFPT